MRRRLSLVTPLLLAFALAAQTATFTHFGNACGATLAGNPPRVGMPFTLTYGGPNSYLQVHLLIDQARPLLVLGTSDRQYGGVPLPWAIPPALAGNRNGCQLLVSPDLVHPMPFAMPLPPTRFVDTLTIPVPMDTSLLGATLFVQWLTFHRKGVVPPYSEWLSTSDAAKAVIGT